MAYYQDTYDDYVEEKHDEYQPARAGWNRNYPDGGQAGELKELLLEPVTVVGGAHYLSSSTASTGDGKVSQVTELQPSSRRSVSLHCPVEKIASGRMPQTSSFRAAMTITTYTSLPYMF